LPSILFLACHCCLLSCPLSVTVALLLACHCCLLPLTPACESCLLPLPFPSDLLDSRVESSHYTMHAHLGQICMACNAMPTLHGMRYHLNKIFVKTRVVSGKVEQNITVQSCHHTSLVAVYSLPNTVCCHASSCRHAHTYSFHFFHHLPKMI